MTMRKTWGATLLFLLSAAGTAQADFEAVETVLGKLEEVQKEAQNVQEELKKVQAEINSIRQGDIGPLSDIASNIKNEVKVDVKMIGPLADKAGDGMGMEDAVEGNLIPQYDGTDQDVTYKAYQETVNASYRENLSRMYAYALSLRANMDKTRKEGGSSDDTVDAEDSRAVLSALSKEATENARRVAHIWDMQTALYELYLFEYAKKLSNTVEPDEEGEEQ